MPIPLILRKPPQALEASALNPVTPTPQPLRSAGALDSVFPKGGHASVFSYYFLLF